MKSKENCDFKLLTNLEMRKCSRVHNVTLCTLRMFAATWSNLQQPIYFDKATDPEDFVRSEKNPQTLVCVCTPDWSSAA